MVLPRGKPVYTNLKTKVVKLDSLLEELSEEGFSGYVKLDFEDDEGVIFLEKGRVVGVHRGSGGRDALSELIKRGISDGSGLISVYSLDPELLSVISAVYSAEPLFSNVPFGIVDTERLMEHLSKKEFTGVLLVEDEKKGATFMAFFFSGEPFDFLYEDPEAALAGDDAMEMMHQLNSSETASFSLIEAVFDRKFEAEDMESAKTTADVIGAVKEFFNAILPEIWPHIGERGFKRAALKLAEDYPFLDPFDPDVYFRDGRIIIEEGIDTDRLIEGMAALLTEIASQIPDEVRKLASASAARLVKDSEAVSELFDALVGE